MKKQTVTQNDKSWTVGIRKDDLSFNLVLKFFSALFYMAAGAKGEFNFNKLSAGDKFQVLISPYLKARSFIQSKQNIFMYKIVLLFLIYGGCGCDRSLFY